MQGYYIFDKLNYSCDLFYSKTNNIEKIISIHNGYKILLDIWLQTSSSSRLKLTFDFEFLVVHFCMHTHLYSGNEIKNILKLKIKEHSCVHKSVVIL